MITRPATRPVLLLLLVAILWAGGCSGGGMSLTEYADGLEAAATRAGQTAEELFGEAAGVTDVTPGQLRAGMERGLAEIRLPLQEAVDALDPPEAFTDLHDLMWGWHADFIAVEEALAERIGATADTEEGWTALSDSPEMAAYRAALAEGKRICRDFQDRLDTREMADAFSGTPWTPGAMGEAIEVALGCQWFPDDPAGVYLYPPAG